MPLRTADTSFLSVCHMPLGLGAQKVHRAEFSRYMSLEGYMRAKTYSEAVHIWLSIARWGWRALGDAVGAGDVEPAPTPLVI